jgi:hypothetical protein
MGLDLDVGWVWMDGWHRGLNVRPLKFTSKNCAGRFVKCTAQQKAKLSLHVRDGHMFAPFTCPVEVTWRLPITDSIMTLWSCKLPISTVVIFVNHAYTTTICSRRSTAVFNLHSHEKIPFRSFIAEKKQNKLNFSNFKFLKCKMDWIGNGSLKKIFTSHTTLFSLILIHKKAKHNWNEIRNKAFRRFFRNIFKLTAIEIWKRD